MSVEYLIVKNIIFVKQSIFNKIKINSELESKISQKNGSGNIKKKSPHSNDNILDDTKKASQ